MSNCYDMKIQSFIDKLSSNSPTPGGGGASALCAAIGSALCSMVCSLTTGKKRFAQYEDDIARLLSSAQELNTRLLALADADEEAFLPLSKAYTMPQDTDEERAEKNRVMQATLIKAAQVPIDIMRAACEAIKLHAELVNKCSKIVISDVGVGVSLLKGALYGASLNVYINTRLMDDKTLRDSFNSQADAMLEKYPTIADEVFSQVLAYINK